MPEGLLERSKGAGVEIPLPSDVVVADEFSATAEADVKPASAVGPDEMILDIGPDTADRFASGLEGAGTIVWNGPVGVFEFDQFGEGTRVIAQAVARSPAFSIAGGGDTIAAIEKYGVGGDISYISTAGGAFLEFLEGKKLPAVEVLEARAAQGPSQQGLSPLRGLSPGSCAFQAGTSRGVASHDAAFSALSANRQSLPATNAPQNQDRRHAGPGNRRARHARGRHPPRRGRRAREFLPRYGERPP